MGCRNRSRRGNADRDATEARRLRAAFVFQAGRPNKKPADGRARFWALAETEGFEPSMRLYTPYSLSRGAPSATRSRLLARAGIMPEPGTLQSLRCGRLVEVERAMQRAHGEFHVLLVDHDRGLDLARG